MNCQEARNLVERVLDRNLSGGVKRRFDLHLSHCEECRAFLATEQAEHQRWFKAVNSPDEPRHSLPPDFADRLVAAIAARSAVRRPFFMRLPRWALIAASLALMAGFVFAAAVAVGHGVLDAMAGRDVLIAPDGDVTVGHDSSNMPDSDVTAGLDVPIAPIDTQLENMQGETVMTEKKVAAVALAATLTAAPLATANGDEYQFIISGDPVAMATEGSSSASSGLAALAVGTLGDELVCESEFEARSRTMDESSAHALRSDPFVNTIIIVR